MCIKCSGYGRVATSPIPGKLIVEIESCLCINDTQGLDRLEQQLQILDKKIEDFEKGLQHAGETLDTGGTGIS